MRTFLKFLTVLFVISVPLEIAALFFPLSRDFPEGSWEGGFYTVSLKCGSLMSPKTLTVANDAVAQDTIKSDMDLLQKANMRVPRGVNIDTYVPPNGTVSSGYVSPAQQVQLDKATCAESRAKVKQFMLWVSPIGLIGCILIVILVVGVVGFALGGGGGGGGGITIRGSARPALGGRGWWVFHFWRS